MGVIKKKTAVRGTEGGVKYVCDVCSADITSTVRIRCADDMCKDFDLCVPCFSQGSFSREHDPRTHAFSVIEQHSIPIFDEDWGADEEALLLEGAETYGLGSWADIADHIGGFREKTEVRDHYLKTFIESSKFPLPEQASPVDRGMTDRIPREEFQARKKRRIETRKEAAKNAPPEPPRQKPTSSVPSCHEVQGYMPGRLEFETEHYNDAEEAVQHMQFDPGEGEDGRPDPEVDLKMTVMDIYNSRLTARVDRKNVIFEHQLLEYRRNTGAEKKRTKEERDLYNKAKPLARLMLHKDFEAFTADLEYELNLREAIRQLQEWRKWQISDLKAGEKYEADKAQREAKRNSSTLGAFDRLNQHNRLGGKPAVVIETPAAVANLTSPELTLKPYHGLPTPPQSVASQDGNEAKPMVNGGVNGHANGTAGGVTSAITERPKFPLQPLPNITPFKLEKDELPNLHLLTDDEKELVEKLRLTPNAYTAIKEMGLREAEKHGGSLKKRAFREICKIDSTKAGKLFDFFFHSGWMTKA